MVFMITNENEIQNSYCCVLNVYVCVLTFMCTLYIQGLREARLGNRSPGNSYRWFIILGTEPMCSL